MNISAKLGSVIKNFSRLNIFVNVMEFRDMHDSLKFCANIKKPNIVLIIKSKFDFEIYANITKIYNMNKFGVFIIFLDNLGICRNPKGNPLNLEFDSKTMVKCQNSIYVNEWYSLNSKTTITTDFLKWSFDQSCFEMLLKKNFHERRKSLQGIRLRVLNPKVFC